jgi:hypothetical protein
LGLEPCSFRQKGPLGRFLTETTAEHPGFPGLLAQFVGICVGARHFRRTSEVTSEGDTRTITQAEADAALAEMEQRSALAPPAG